MAKKLHQSMESNNQGGGLSREDRKNEAIMRMIERAEKQRIKKEEKKKLAVSTLGPLIFIESLTRSFLTR